MEKIGVINGKQLGCFTPTIISMSDHNCSNKQPDSKYGSIHTQCFSGQFNGIQMKNLPFIPPNSYHPIRSSQNFVRFKALCCDSEERSYCLQLELEVLCFRGFQNIRHGGFLDDFLLIFCRIHEGFGFGLLR